MKTRHVVTAAMLCASLAWADAVTIVSARSVSIGIGGKRTVHFVADVDASVRKTEPPTLLDVSIGKARQPELDLAFAPMAADGGIALKIDGELLPGHGVYTVRSRVISLLNDGGTTTDTLSFEVTVAPAELVVGPSKVIVHRGPLSEEGGEFSLRETTGRSNVRALVATEVEPATNGTERVSGAFTITAPAVAAGQKAPVKYAIGSVSLGRTTGKLELTSTDLSKPVTVDYEIVTRVPVGFIGVIALLGIALGMFVRKILHGQIGREQQDRDRRAMLELLDQQIGAHRDAQFLEKIRDARSEVAGAPRPQLADAIKDAQATLKAEKDGLVRRRETEENRLSRLEVSLRTAEQLPEQFLQSVRAATAAHVVQASAALKDKNAASAAQSLTTAEEKFSSELNRQAAKWRQRLLTALGGLTAKEFPFPEAEVTKLADEARASLSGLGVAAAPDITMKTVFDAAAKFELCVLELLRMTANTTDKIRWSVGKVCTDEQRERLSFHVAELRGLANGDWEVAMGRFDAVSSATLELVVFFRAWLEKADETKKKQASELIEKRNFVGAAQLFSDGAADTLLGDEEAAIDVARQGESAKPQFISQVPAVVSLGSELMPRMSLETPTRFDALSKQQAIIAVLLVASAYVVFGSSFGYSYTDMLAVFIWGFGLDLTSNELTALKGSKPG